MYKSLVAMDQTLCQNIIVFMLLSNINIYENVQFLHVDQPDLINIYLNIDRGTTDPGYQFYNLNYLFYWIEFVFIQAAEMNQVLNSIPWVHCASGNVLA